MNFKKSEAFWSLLDQAAVSGGNFLTALVLARSLTKADYGTFSLLFLVLLSLNTLHSSLVIYPLTVTVAKSDDEASRELLGRCFFHTGILWFVWVAILLVPLIVLHRADVFVSLALAMLTWQLQEVARRALLANADARNAIVPDCLSYMGQAALLLVFHPRSLSEIFFIVAGTSSAALAWQAWIARPVFRDLFEREHIAESWELGKYTLIANALNMAILQLPSWALDRLQGRAIVGSYQALSNLVGIANPIIFSMSNMLIPEVARSSAKGLRHVRTIMVKNGAIFSALLFPCFILLGLFPGHVMAIAYGKTSPYLPMAPLLRIMTITLVFQFMASLIGAYEGGLSRPRTFMFAQIVSLGTLATFGIGLMKEYGIAGAVYGGVLAAGARMLTFLVLSSRGDRAMISASAAGEQ